MSALVEPAIARHVVRLVRGIDAADVWRAPGQTIGACPRCGLALVDTGDGIWAHAIGVEPCGWKAD